MTIHFGFIHEESSHILTNDISGHWVGYVPIFIEIVPRSLWMELDRVEWVIPSFDGRYPENSFGVKSGGQDTEEFP